jgi:hypothetical protein
MITGRQAHEFLPFSIRNRIVLPSTVLGDLPLGEFADFQYPQSDRLAFNT